MSIPDDILIDARRRFLPRANVIGVGWGPKLRNGQVVARHSIVVFVDVKLPIEMLGRDDLIPTEHRNIPTDVRVPVLTPEAAADPHVPADRCLTDHTWIDWGRVHERHTARQPRPR